MQQTFHHTHHRLSHILLSFGFFVALISSLLLATVQTKIFAIGSGEIFTLSNTQRTNNGLSSFTFNSQLASAAQQKAEHMKNNNYFEHTAPDGTTGWTFINASGYSYQSAGENLAATNETSEAVVDGWMNSPGHRANLLSSTFSEVGYGVIYVGNWQEFSDVYFVVALYGQPTNSASPSPAPQPTPEPSPQPEPEEVAEQPVVPQPQTEVDESIAEANKELEDQNSESGSTKASTPNDIANIKTPGSSVTPLNSEKEKQLSSKLLAGGVGFGSGVGIFGGVVEVRRLMRHQSLIPRIRK